MKNPWTLRLIIFSLICGVGTGCTKDSDIADPSVPPSPESPYYIRYKEGSTWRIQYLDGETQCFIGGGFCCTFQEGPGVHTSFGILRQSGDFPLTDVDDIVGDTIPFNETAPLRAFYETNFSNTEVDTTFSYLIVDDAGPMEMNSGVARRMISGQFRCKLVGNTIRSLNHGSFRFWIY